MNSSSREIQGTMNRLENVAFGKPANQSSTCEHSRASFTAVDAAFAVNGQTDDHHTFHTHRENRPWWEVDLLKAFELVRIKIHNRIAEKQRFCNFTIMVSEDHIDWRVCFVKCDPRTFEDIEVRLDAGTVARYVRIRLDGYEFLHLREVEIYGRSQPALLTRPSESFVDNLTVFSVLFNESSDFLKALIDNLKAFTGGSEMFVLNIAMGCPVDISGFDVPSKILMFRSQEARFPNGHTLLCGHLENVERSISYFGSFDYFVPIASNSLFVRRFDVRAALAKLKRQEATHWYVPRADITTQADGSYAIEERSWNFPRIEKQSELLKFLSEQWHARRLVPMQIEGLFAPAAYWKSLAAWRSQIAEVASRMDQDYLFPCEEVLPVTFFQAQGYADYCLICQVLWHPFRTEVDLRQLSQPAWHLPAHVCLMKWFERQPGRTTTLAVSSPLGRELMSLIARILETEDVEEVIDAYHLIGGFGRTLQLLMYEQRSYSIDTLD